MKTATIYQGWIEFSNSYKSADWPLNLCSGGYRKTDARSYRQRKWNTSSKNPGRHQVIRRNGIYCGVKSPATLKFSKWIVLFPDVLCDSTICKTWLSARMKPKEIADKLGGKENVETKMLKEMKGSQLYALQHSHTAEV